MPLTTLMTMRTRRTTILNDSLLLREGRSLTLAKPMTTITNCIVLLRTIKRLSRKELSMCGIKLYDYTSSESLLECILPGGIKRHYTGVFNNEAHWFKIKRAFKYRPNQLYTLLKGYGYFDGYLCCQFCKEPFKRDLPDPLCRTCEWMSS
jgi:hypothetical protein